VGRILNDFTFESFAPITGAVDCYAIPSSSEIVAGARKLLAHASRTDEETLAALYNIEYFFADAPANYRLKLRFDDSELAEMDELEMLEEFVHIYDLGGDANFIVGQPYEYLAVWAIYCVSRAAALLAQQYPAIPASLDEAHTEGEVRAFAVTRLLIEGLKALHSARSLLHKANEKTRNTANSWLEAAQQPKSLKRIEAARAAHQRSKKALDKNLIKEEWLRWLDKPHLYKGKTEFSEMAKDAVKAENLKDSPAVIRRWILHEWEPERGIKWPYRDFNL